MALAPLDSITVMLAPVALVTTSAVLLAGTLGAYGAFASRIFDLRRERDRIMTGPDGEILGADSVTPADRQRLVQIDSQVETSLSRSRLMKNAAVILYCAILVLVVAVILIGIADSAASLTLAYVALALVLCGAVALLAAVLLSVGFLFGSAGTAKGEAGRERG